MKTTITILFLLIATSANANFFNGMEEHGESREQCQARNKANNKALEEAGYYVSPETKEEQKKDCAKKKPDNRRR